MEKLDRYLRERNITLREFAEAIESSEATISRVRAGKQKPSTDLIQRIVTHTKGAIRPDDFFEIPKAAHAR